MSKSASGLSHRQRTILNSTVIGSVIAAIATIVVALIASRGWTTSPNGNGNVGPLMLSSSHSVSKSESFIFWPATNFKVTSLHNKSVIQQTDLPLTIKGTYASQGLSGEFWVVLVDSKGQYYIQNPQVRFQTGGEWTAYNVQPLTGIIEIDFVFVDQAGTAFFEKKVANGEWGAFSTLPTNNKTLARISIISEASTSV